tara:strand:- start:1632 stop:2531 length:900 start_codon:yes stop_codon:yes gene_type:complete
MRILISGKNSQIGKELQLLNHKNKYDLIFLDSKEMNLLNFNQIEAQIFELNPDLIINLSAFTNVEKAEIEKNNAFKVNAEAPALIASLASEVNAKMIHISSDYVFGENDSPPFGINSSTGPVNYYGETKLEGEFGVTRNNRNSIIIRTSSVFSAFNNNFVKSIYCKLINNDHIKVVNDQNINLTYAKDLALLIIDLINLISGKVILKDNEPMILHYSNLGYTSWFEVANYIKEAKIMSKKDLVSIEPIKSEEWKSMAKRSKDTRLEIDYGLLNSLDIKLQDWKSGVLEVLETLAHNEKR